MAVCNTEPLEFVSLQALKSFWYKMMAVFQMSCLPGHCRTSDELKYPFMNTHVPDVFILIEFKVDVFDDRNWMLSHHFIRVVELSVFAVLVRQKAIYASL